MLPQCTVLELLYSGAFGQVSTSSSNFQLIKWWHSSIDGNDVKSRFQLPITFQLNSANWPYVQECGMRYFVNSPFWSDVL